MGNNFKLNNEVLIPSIGFGTWQISEGKAVVNAVKCALTTGYKHIDTAAVYGNEKGVGQAIKESGTDRKELFITSKVWNTERGYEPTLKAFDQTLSDLQLDYLDLYLIHWPATKNQFNNWEQINYDTWRALEELYRLGRVRAIGLSNFLPQHIEPLLEQATILPMVNQIEYQPGYMQTECVEFCNKHNILVEAWSPLGSGKLLKNETLQAIAKKYNKSVAQLCIKWVLQNGILPLPKSATPKRIKENLEVTDFTIELKDMDTINQMIPSGISGLHPDRVDF